MSAHPDTLVSRLGAGERTSPALPGPGPTIPYDRDASIPDLFEGVVERWPEAAAVEQGPRSLTYAELDAAADRVASRLVERGFGPGEIVGVAIERSPEVIVAFLGVLKAGAAYLPLDPGHPPNRLGLILSQASAVAILAAREGLERLRDLGLRVPLIDVNGYERVSDRAPERRSGAGDVAYVIYTSGSTGSPKGIEALHRGVVREVRGSGHSAIGPGDAVLGANPFIFDGSIHEIYGPLLNGGRLVLAPSGMPSPEVMRRLVREHEVSVVMPPAAVFCELVDAGLSGFEGVREFFVGGDVLSPDHVRRALRALPGCAVVNCYGPAETTCDACAHRMDDPAMVGDRVPIGRALGNTRAYVLDERMQPVGTGAEGELYVGGDGLARGYLGSPELTAERFVADPFDPGGNGRLYRTGDRVRLLDERTLDFVGRLDDQVKIRGFRVEPAEVEAALASHPGISRSAVVARDDGAGHPRLVAYAVPGDAGVSVGQVRDHLATELPAHMVPAEVVMIASLPQTASGKVDRGALRPPPPPVAGRGPAPQAAVERRLAAIWADLLGVDGIGMEDDFLDLGGDSLLVMRLVARITASEGVELPPEAVFEAPTLGSLAARVAERDADGAAWGPIRRSSDRAFAPLTFAQERTWFLQRLEPASLAYQFQDLLWLEGELDVGALRRALRAMVRRHEILRTTFPWGDGGPIQVIHAPWRVRLRPLDLIDLPEAEREPALREQVGVRVRRRFDITRLPLARWALFRLGERRHALLHVEHHLVHDGWSWAVFRRELAELYAAFADGRPSPLPDPEIQLADLARWQRAAMAGEPAASQLEAWRERLRPPPPALQLPADRPRPPRQTFRGERLHADLPGEVAERLRALGASGGATPFMIMLAAFYTLLHGLTAEDDLCVGTGVANRRRPESEPVLGMVLNTLALRLDAGGDPTGSELVRRARATVIHALANQDVPFDRVVETVRPRRDPGRMPLFDVLFSFDDAPRPPTRAGGLGIAADEGVSNSSAKADLNAIVVNRRAGPAGVGGLRLLWEYNADLFDADTAARMLGAYRRVLDALLHTPDRRLSELLAAAGLPPPRSRPERATARSGGAARYERDATINQLFEARASERPHAPALELAERALTYRQLDQAANRLARRLRALGAGPETLVGVFMERSPELVVGLLGILKAGAAYLPLEPEYPPARLAFMLSDAGAPLVLTQPALAARLPGNGAQVVTLDPGLEALEGEAAGPLASGAGPESLAYVMYTSGSTGLPKGVEALHRGVVRLVRGTDYVDLGPDQVHLLLAPIAFDASTFEIWGALLNGGRLAIAPPGLPSLAELGEVVRRHRVTTLWLSAGLFCEMVDGNPAGLGGLRQLLAGGDVLSPAHVRRALEAHPGLRLVNGYGPTETTTFACCHAVSDPAEAAGPIPIGRPIANTTIRILDGDGRPAPDGTEAELYIGGDGLARGYRGRPELTAERFVADPLAPGERLYRTGDLVRRRPDGVLDFLGRVDDQVKIRGFRVEPGEIEAALREHPEVAAAAVVARADGSGGKRLVAYVVPAAGSAGVDPLPWLAERLPGHMVPSSWVRVAALPLSPNGKVDRARLATAAPDGDGERGGVNGGATVLARNGGAPRTGTERRLAAIWGRLLDARTIRRDDDFFSLGGHSLMTLRLFADIELEFGRRLPVASIFEAPTLAQLACRIDTDGAAAAWKSLVPIAPAGWKRPFFCVHGAGGNVALFAKLGRSLDAERPLYGLQAQGLDGTTRPHRQIEAMATHYLTEMRAVQPRGPYLLGGICKGAQVALEMSQQLQAAGDEVALLVVLDSKGPNLDGAARRDVRRRRQRRRQRRKVRTSSDRRLRLVRKRWRRMRLVVRRARRRSWPERIGAARATLRPHPDSEHLKRVRRANKRAIRTYVARPFAGRIALIESEQTARRPEGGARSGWARLASGGLDYVVAPGDHRSMLREPHVGVVADRLAQLLDGAEGLSERRR